MHISVKINSGPEDIETEKFDKNTLALKILQFNKCLFGPIKHWAEF